MSSKKKYTEENLSGIRISGGAKRKLLGHAPSDVKKRDTDTQGEGGVAIEAQGGGTGLQARECQELPVTPKCRTEARKTVLPPVLQREHSLAML